MKTEDKTNLTLHMVGIEAVQVSPMIAAIRKGMEDQKEEVDLLVGGVSDHVMMAARLHNMDHEGFYKEYKAECEWLKSKEGEKETGVQLGGKIPRCFIQAVSDVRKGMEAGIDPSSFESYHSFKQAKIKVSKASKKGDGEGGEGGEGEEGGKDNVLQGDDNLLSGPVSTLLSELKKVPEDSYGKAVAILEETIKNIQILADVVPSTPVKVAKKKTTKKTTKKVSANTQAAA